MAIFRVVVLCIVVCVADSNNTQCDTLLPRDLRLSVASRRNFTGHWITQVKLEHGEKEIIGQQDSGAWEVDIDHSTTKGQGFESVVLVATVSAPPKRAAPNYEFIYGLGYYKLHTEALPWHQARFICAQEGAHLAIINSQRELTELRAFMARHPKMFTDWRNYYTYIGINNIRSDGQWVTIFDDPLNTTGYMSWAPNQPDDGKSGNCGLIHRREDLHDVGCNEALAFFCEQEL